MQAKPTACFKTVDGRKLCVGIGARVGRYRFGTIKKIEDKSVVVKEIFEVNEGQWVESEFVWPLVDRN